MYSYHTFTDVGKIRTTNEDSVFVSSNRYGHTLAIVADGMGGHNAGDVASKVIVNKISKIWATTSNITSITQAKKWLTTQIKEVNTHILKYAKTNGNLSGMGSTVVIAICLEDYTIIANVGDSRAYALCNTSLIQITHDQTLVNELINQGEITELEAKFHPKKNILMQAVGTNKLLKIDFYEIENSYKYLLLCSDGLSNMVDHKTIEKILLDNKEISETVKLLVNTANTNGGHDNITVVLLKDGD
ncbi:MAG: Stp1/IreP family PP2C-type Ser/Thr phosphatase [Bacilli bacterium]